MLPDGAGSIPDFRRMVEAMPVAAYTTDMQGRLTYFNPAAANLCGRTPELGTDQWCVTWKLYLPDGSPLPHDQSPLAIVLKGGTVREGMECIAERPDGTRFWFICYPALLRETSGRPTGGVNLLLDITQRKNAELEAQEQSRAIVETTPECVKIVAADGTLLHMNPAGLELLGAAHAADVVGRSVYELIAPQDRERFQQFHERICRGEKGSLEFEIVGLNGIRRQMESHAAPLRHPDGTIVQLAITRNTTERKSGERAALLLGAIVDSSDDAIISKDLNGIITSWNQSARRLFGYTAEEAIGKSITMLIPDDRQDEEPNILARLKRGERVDHFETIRRRKDGSLLNISLTISPVKDRQGRIIGASKIARDITERKRAEAALLISEARFRQLADAMPQIVWTARADGSIDYYNEQWYDFTGFSRDDFGDATWSRILHPDDLDWTRQEWHSAVASAKPFEVACRFWDRRENRWRWFMSRARPVRTADETITKWFGSCTDIDDQKRLEEELRSANKDLEQFAYSASHDLQEPLRSVKIYSELLSNVYGGQLQGEALEFLRFLHGGATRMEMLVRDLLAYTQATHVESNAGIADAGEAFQHVVDNLAASISQTGATVSAGPLPRVRIHPAHLQQILQNLSGNAVKYHRPGIPPVVHVTAEQQNGDCLFAVRDNGIGVPAEYRERIFGLFKRLHNNDQYSGTGIGLAICKRIVDRYHGRIWVESGPEGGSVFLFTIPV
jgi:PAS domain S-box-containing protein